MIKRTNPIDFIDQLKSLHANGLPAGDSTGFKAVDELYTVATKQWTVVTGAPSSGANCHTFSGDLLKYALFLVDPSGHTD